MSMFSEKSFLTSERSFSPADLLDFVESVIKSVKATETRRSYDNYSWLRSRTVRDEKSTAAVMSSLAQLKPVVDKLPPSSCAAIAVKLDNFTENTINPTAEDLVMTFKNLLEEQSNIQMMEDNIKDRRRRSKKMFKTNKVKPELLPPGREATVCFILDSEFAKC